jgi:hypothetical protein
MLEENAFQKQSYSSFDEIGQGIKKATGRMG